MGFQTSPEEIISERLSCEYFLLLKYIFFLFQYFFWWDWGLNSELCICKAATLLLEPHLQHMLLWLFWRWGSLELFALAGLEP
jgi:hypothetical protein